MYHTKQLILDSFIIRWVSWIAKLVVLKVLVYLSTITSASAVISYSSSLLSLYSKYQVPSVFYPHLTHTFFRLLKASFMLLLTVLIVIPSLLGFVSSWLWLSLCYFYVWNALPNSVPPHLPTCQQICSKNASSELLTESDQIQNTIKIFFIHHWLLAASCLFPFVI